MTASKAQIKATKRYNDRNYEQINLIVKRGQKSELKEAAERLGESLNGFINKAIAERLERERWYRS